MKNNFKFSHNTLHNIKILIIFAPCFLEARIFICSNFSAELGPRKRYTSNFSNTHLESRTVRRL